MSFFEFESLIISIGTLEGFSSTACFTASISATWLDGLSSSSYTPAARRQLRYQHNKKTPTEEIVRQLLGVGEALDGGVHKASIAPWEVSIAFYTVKK